MSGSGARRPRWPALAPYAVAVSTCLWFFWPLLSGHVIYERDVYHVWHGQMEAIVRAIAQGALPLWDSTASFGEPLMALPAQILYPFTWLGFLVPAGPYYSISVLFHHVFGGIGMILLLERLGVGALARCVGVAVWMSSGPWISVANMLNLFTGTAWLPWMLLLADRAAEKPTARSGALWGGSIALCLLTCSEPVFMGGLISGVWFVYRSHASGAPLKTAALCLTAAFGFSLALSAGQWFPLVQALQSTPRANLEEMVRTFASLHPLTLLSLALPFSYRHLPLPEIDAFSDIAMPLLSTVFLGGGAMVLAVAGARRWGAGRALGAMAAMAVLIAAGRHLPVYDVASQVLPFMRALRFPVKGTLAVAFLVAILAARGFDRLPESARLVRGATLGLVASQLLLLASGASFSEGIFERRTPSPAPIPGLFADEARALFHEVPNVVGGVGVSVPLLLLFAFALAPRRIEAWRVPAALAVSLAPAIVNLGHNDFAPASLLTFRPATVDFLRAERAQRVYFAQEMSSIEPPEVPGDYSPGVAFAANIKQSMPPTVLRLFGFRGSFETDLKNTHPLPLRALRRVVADARKAGVLPMRLLRIAGVSHVILTGPDTGGLGPPAFSDRTITGNRVHVIRVPDPLPLCLVADGVRALDGAMAAMDLMQARYDPRRIAIVPEVPSRAAAALRAGTCDRTEPEPNRIDATVTAEVPSVAIFTDTWDEWWTATVDGIPARVVRANLAFMGVEVPAGRHRIALRYAPRPLFNGLWISAFGVVAFAILVARRPNDHAGGTV